MFLHTLLLLAIGTHQCLATSLPINDRFKQYLIYSPSAIVAEATEIRSVYQIPQIPQDGLSRLDGGQRQEFIPRSPGKDVILLLKKSDQTAQLNTEAESLDQRYTPGHPAGTPSLQPYDQRRFLYQTPYFPGPQPFPQAFAPQANRDEATRVYQQYFPDYNPFDQRRLQGAEAIPKAPEDNRVKAEQPIASEQEDLAAADREPSILYPKQAAPDQRPYAGVPQAAAIPQFYLVNGQQPLYNPLYRFGDYNGLYLQGIPFGGVYQQAAQPQQTGFRSGIPQQTQKLNPTQSLLLVAVPPALGQDALGQAQGDDRSYYRSTLPEQQQVFKVAKSEMVSEYQGQGAVGIQGAMGQPIQSGPGLQPQVILLRSGQVGSKVENLPVESNKKEVVVPHDSHSSPTFFRSLREEEERKDMELMNEEKPLENPAKEKDEENLKTSDNVIVKNTVDAEMIPNENERIDVVGSEGKVGEVESMEEQKLSRVLV